MDEITRLQSDQSQLTKRVDDMSLRLAVVETKHNAIEVRLAQMEAKMDRWNWFLISAMGGGILLQLITVSAIGKVLAGGG